MATIRFKPEQFARWMGKLGERADRELRLGFAAGGLRAVAHMQRESSARGIVDTGAYKRGWKSGPLASGEPGTQVYNDQVHAPIIEHGRRAGSRQPPTRYVEAWLRRRGLSAKEARRAAFPVARAIARRGLRARRVLANALDDLTRLVLAEVKRHLRRAVTPS